MKFNRLTLVKEITRRRSKDGHKLGIWMCDCGKTKTIAMSRVRHGYSKSCGCLVSEVSSAQATIHGMKGTPEYSTWGAMLTRCYNPNSKDYPRYGAKGITVCPEWKNSFEKFYEHVGPRPPGTTIDRIKNSKGYEPGNVRWATSNQQARNRSSSKRWVIKGLEFETAKEAGAHFGVSDQTITRWVYGSFDQRRGTGYPKKEDCHAY